MTNKPVFKGIATAMITPFKNGKIDFDAFGKFIDFQINEGIDALVVCGTTGEAATLDDSEHKKAIEFVCEYTSHRVPVIAGTGSNDTAYSISLSRFACEAGADALLCVTPYYNKTTQRGLIRHFETIADAVEKPVILYNVPSRTGLNIEPQTYAVLAKHPNITGIKEANGNITKIAETVALVGNDIDLYSGNDEQIVPIMGLGGIGGISVVSNILPAKTAKICSRFFAGDTSESLAIQLELMDLINALFCEVNPIPVKAACSAMGLCENSLRLPLVEMEPEHEQKLIELMRAQGLNV
ncbi:MAG TPA: 4-hydroxy-tetrahydrodipicolinate synthase [Bacillota bacterium]|nr:4-hydroxy-tetrahydrodipicolinate synthase [Bacillota bacterium]